MQKKVSKYIKQNKRYIYITKTSDTSITVIYHGMSLTVLYVDYEKPIQWTRRVLQALSMVLFASRSNKRRRIEK